MYRSLLLLAGFVFSVRAAEESSGPPSNPWPTATLVSPPSGILIVGEGRSTEIKFNVGGDPFPRDKAWYKDGHKITSSSNINIDESGGNLYSLKFNAISIANEGTYYTIVKNLVSLEASKSPEVILKVSFLREIWDTSRTQEVQARVGEFAVLECRPPEHFGAYPKFTWAKGSETIVESDNIYISEYGNLVILQVAYEHFASDYRCTITIDSLKEGFQTRQGPSVSLVVVGSPASYVAPQIALKPIDLSINAQIKETFRVECAVNGYPNLPNIKWYKDSVQITSSSVIYDLQKRNYLRITIPRSGGSVGGTYRCEAYDGSNQIYASANIQIYTKPIITTGLPTAAVKKSSGSELTLSCVATATPNPTYVWYKNAAVLTPSINTRIDGGSLAVSNVNSLNRGVYQCEAINGQGSTISTGMIRVQERLTFVIRPDDVEVYLGTSATFNCQGKGNPGPESLQWQFNGGNPPSTHEYTNNIVNQATYKIPKVTSSERDGRISCIISSPDNLYPTDTATAILTIREGPQVKAHTKNVTVIEGNSVDLACTVQNAGTGVAWKWLFEDILIIQPDDFRITIKHNLLQIRALTEADQGTYTCQADENGLSNHDDMFVRVKTYPRVELDSDVRIGEGADARLTCRVTANPTPTISWRRNGKLIRDSDQKYRIEEPAAGTSILVVEQVNKATDVGQYSCYGLNELGESNKIINLIVVAACEVMNIPKDQEVEYQSSVIISCTVNNCPAAMWTWRKNGQLITFDGSRTIDRGQAIELKQVVPSDAGEYSCTVISNNNLNKRGTYNATITVKVDAKITSFPDSRVLFKGGDPVVMKCAAHGDDSKQSLNVEWFKAGARQNTGQPEIRKDPNERISYVTSTLLITNAIASDAGHYQCIASNGFSDDKRDTSLMLMTFPDRPGQAYNTWTGVGAVELAWREPPNTGNTPLTSYEIQIEMKGNSIFRPFIQGLNPRSVNAIIYFLQENQEYKFKVIAINAVGKGPPSISSNEIRTIKTNIKRDNLVEDFTLTAISSDSIVVKWEMPLRRTQALKGYKIVYRNEDMNEPPKFKMIDDYTMLESTLADLAAGSQYSIQVESNTQVTVSLVVSTVKHIYTFNQKPTEPMECIADRETTSRLVISWNTPENSHGKILQYTIYYQDKAAKEDGQWTVVVHSDPQTTSYAMQLLDDGLDYKVKISASNSAGEGYITVCTATGQLINEDWFITWWFYVIIALLGAFILGVFIVCVILCYRRRSEKGPKMQKIPPVGVKKESGRFKFKNMFSRKTHVPLRNQDDFRGPAAQVYSPNTARSYNPMNTFSGGGMGTSPYQSPEYPVKFGGGAGDFRYGSQPRSPDFGAPDYGYNKFNTFDSRATYNDPPKPSYSAHEPPKPSYSAHEPPKPSYSGHEPPKPSYSGREPPKPSYSAHEPPKSPYEAPRSPRGLGGYDQGSNYDNNTFDSRFRDNGSRGYPTSTYDRSNSYGGGGAGGGGGGNFKSSQL